MTNLTFHHLTDTTKPELNGRFAICRQKSEFKRMTSDLSVRKADRAYGFQTLSDFCEFLRIFCDAAERSSDWTEKREINRQNYRLRTRFENSACDFHFGH